MCDAGCVGTSRLLEDDNATAERGWRRLQRVNGEASLHGGVGSGAGF